MAQRKIDLLFWGYVADALHALLKPYMKGISLQLTPEDKNIVEQSQRFLNSILTGFDTINSPERFSFAHAYTRISTATALALAIEIFSVMSVTIPNDLDEFKKRLNSYREILENLKDSKPITNSDMESVAEVASFFKALGDKADQQAYESTYSV